MERKRSIPPGTRVEVQRVQCPEESNGYEVEIYFDGERFTGICECQKNCRLGMPCWHLMSVLSKWATLMNKRDFMKMAVSHVSKPGTKFEPTIRRLWIAKQDKRG